MTTSFTMILCCGFLLLFLDLVSCKDYTNDYGSASSVNVDQVYSSSFHNGARVIQLRKREVQAQGGIIGQNGTVMNASNKELNQNATINPIVSQSEQRLVVSNAEVTQAPQTYVPVKPGLVPNQEKKYIEVNGKLIAHKNQTTVTESDIASNSTLQATPSPLDMNSPGVMKRGVIVFGGFLLLAVAYFIFYRWKSNKNDSGNLDNPSNTNQFRYGVLESEDIRDKMELSRIPLTMESDEEDDDLEIFDLEQKKKSLSYINLETNDEDIVFNNSREGNSDIDNLLLDIEDGSSDTLINWSNNGSKSIL